MGMRVGSPLARSNWPLWSGQSTMQPSSRPMDSGADMCGHRSSVAVMPFDVCASNTSRSPKVTRRMAPGGSSATASARANAAPAAPIAVRPGGMGAAIGVVVTTPILDRPRGLALGPWVTRRALAVTGIGAKG